MMKIISIDKENIDAEHICCAIGNDLKNKTRTESKKHKIPVEIKKLKNHKEAQDLGSPFGTLGIYFDGTFLTHELMTEKKFETLIVGLGL